MALAYVRDALPKETLHAWSARHAATASSAGSLLAVGLALAARARGGRAAQVEHRAPLEADEARLHRARHRGALHGGHVVADAGRALISDACERDASASTPERAARPLSGSRASRPRARGPRPSTSRCSSTSARAGAEPARSSTRRRSRIRASAAEGGALRLAARRRDQRRRPEVARVRKKYGVTEGLPVVLLFGSDGGEAFRFTEVSFPPTASRTRSHRSTSSARQKSRRIRTMTSTRFLPNANSMRPRAGRVGRRHFRCRATRSWHSEKVPRQGTSRDGFSVIAPRSTWQGISLATTFGITRSDGRLYRHASNRPALTDISLSYQDTGTH